MSEWVELPQRVFVPEPTADEAEAKFKFWNEAVDGPRPSSVKRCLRLLRAQWRQSAADAPGAGLIPDPRRSRVAGGHPDVTQLKVASVHVAESARRVADAALAAMEMEMDSRMPKTGLARGF